MNDRILSPQEVFGPGSVTGLRRTWVYHLIQRGEFPPGFKHPGAKRSIGWLESDIRSWLTEREKRKTAKKLPRQAEG